MNYFMPLLLILSLSFPAQAEKERSIMFDDPDPIYTEAKKNTAADDHADFCKKLRQEMKDLEGKPLRRNPVVKRYQAECVDFRN